MVYKVKDIVKLINGELVGDGEVAIRGLNGIKEAGEGDLSFLVDLKYEALLDSTKASCIIVPRALKKTSGKTLIKVDNPSIAFSRIIEFAMPDRIPHPKGIHASAVIAKSARIGKKAAIGAYVVMEEGSSIGDGTVIYPFCYIGRNTKIGRDCIFYPNVTVREEISVGDRVIIHPGTVIGSDGFGYDTNSDGTHTKIPQLGTVVIEDDVELGACVTVDRARLNKTVIGRGSKIDNLVQIAHNVIIGPNCLIAAQTGIAGSSKLGRNVVLGGQVGITDHAELGDFVKVGAKSGITKSFPANTTLFWFPAKPVDQARDIIAAINLLPKLYQRVNALEDKLKKSEKK